MSKGTIYQSRLRRERVERGVRTAIVIIFVLAWLAYVAIGGWWVERAYRNPIIARSVSDERFLVPKVEVCGLCYFYWLPESCGRIHCSFESVDIPGETDDTGSCDEWVTPYDVDCFTFTPPPGAFFKNSDTATSRLSSKLDFLLKWGPPTADAALEQSRELGVFEISTSLTLLIVDQTGDLGNRDSADSAATYYSEIMTTTVIDLDISRTLRKPIRNGQDTYRTDIVSRMESESEVSLPDGVDSEGRLRSSVKFSLLTSDVFVNVEEETATFTEWEYLGNVAGLLSGMLALYTLLLGDFSNSPWGILQRRLLKTDPKHILSRHRSISSPNLSVKDSGGEERGSVEALPSEVTSRVHPHTAVRRATAPTGLHPPFASSNDVDPPPALGSRRADLERSSLRETVAQLQRRHDQLEKVLSTRYCKHLDKALAVERAEWEEREGQDV